MIKLLAGILVVFIASTVGSRAQMLIKTTQGEEYIGIVSSQDKDSLSLRTFENKDLRFSYTNIDTPVKMKTRIELQSGEIYIGTISKISEKEYVLISENTGEIKIQTDQIVDIQLAAVDGKFTYFDNVRNFDASEHENKSKDKYHMFGATFGYPDLINLLYGYQFDKIGFRISGGTILWTFGLKGSIVYNIFKSEYTEHSLAITTAWSSGFSRLIPEGNSYGVTYSINLFGLFAEFGIGRTIDVYKEIFFIGQAGIVWRFN
ncbi:MAG: hypothetical protein KAH48_01965 [Chlorobi bacterium]|nr:hypothetical protein [Chlorobiota bacterium]